MRRTRNALLIAFSLLTSCTVCVEGPEEPVDFGPPLPVEKTQALPVLMHYMPWFESAPHDGQWGQHWTMATANPDLTGADGLPDIAAHFHPLIGPYSSFDVDVLEYHALLMKYVGVDAAVIDWYGTHNVLDYGRLDEATEAFIAVLKSVGIDYALMYEDRTLANVPMSHIDAATADWEHLAMRHFTDTAYFQVDDAPWVGVFGPIELENPAEWAAVFDNASIENVRLHTLWGEQADAGPQASGEFAWVWAGNGTDHFAAVETFTEAASAAAARVGIAYPGFEDYYAPGGWGDGLGWTIDPAEGQTFRDLLSLATTHAQSLEALQIATWNDFGEGTMVEPTAEDGFARLLDLQAFAGVPYGLAELELIHELYLKRKQNAGNPDVQADLDAVRGFLLRLDPDAAAARLAEI